MSVRSHTAGLLKEAGSCQKSGAILLHDLGWVLLNIVTALHRPVSSAVTQVIPEIISKNYCYI